MHITFETGKDNAANRQSLSILVAGKFSYNPNITGPISVDKTSILELIERVADNLLFEVPNHLASQPSELCINLRITDLTCFSPAGIATQVPELKQALGFRDQLAALASGTLTFNEFEAGLDAYRGLDAFSDVLDLCRRAMQSEALQSASKPPLHPADETTTPITTKKHDAIDRILDMVGGNSAVGAEPSMTRLQQVISGIGTENQLPNPPMAFAEALATTDRILSRQYDEILHCPQFQECEALWRGLKLLIDRTDFRSDIQIQVLSIGRDHFGKDIHERILTPIMTGQMESLPSLIVIPYSIENHPSDIEQLQLLGEAANEIQIPMLISTSPAFFELDEEADPAIMPYPGSLLSRQEYAKWNSLRDKDASRWLCMCFNRFLLRSPYISQQRNSLGLIETIRRHNDYLWGESVWLLACLISASFARTGWPTEITGMDNGHIEGLPTHRVTRPDMQEMEIPLEMMPSAQLAEDLAGYGFIPLICKPNRDSVYVLKAPMLHRPEVYDDDDSTAASRAMAQLPYQLFASRISQVLMNIIPKLGSRSLSTDDLGNAINDAVTQLITDTGSDASVSVDIQNLPNTSGKRQVELSIYAGKRLVDGATVRLKFIV